MNLEELKNNLAGVAMIVAVVAFVYFTKGNTDLLDGLTRKSNIYTYAEVLLPSGKVKAGAVKSWRDYESDAVKIIFEDGTDIITSYNRAVLSKGAIKP